MNEYQKLGRDVIKRTSAQTQTEFSSHYLAKEYRNKVLQALAQSDKPLNVSQIRQLTGITWTAVKTALIDLALTNQIECFRSGKHFLSRIKKEKNLL